MAIFRRAGGCDRLGLAVGLAVGLADSLAFGLAVGLGNSLADALAVGLSDSLAFGLGDSLAHNLAFGWADSLAVGLAHSLAVDLALDRDKSKTRNSLDVARYHGNTRNSLTVGHKHGNTRTSLAAPTKSGSSVRKGLAIGSSIRKGLALRLDKEDVRQAKRFRIASTILRRSTCKETHQRLQKAPRYQHICIIDQKIKCATFCTIPWIGLSALNDRVEKPVNSSKFMLGFFA